MPSTGSWIIACSHYTGKGSFCDIFHKLQEEVDPFFALESALTSQARNATTAFGNLSPVAERSTCLPAHSFLDLLHFLSEASGSESPLIIMFASGRVVLEEGNMAKV